MSREEHVKTRIDLLSIKDDGPKGVEGHHQCIRTSDEEVEKEVEEVAVVVVPDTVVHPRTVVVHVVYALTRDTKEIRDQGLGSPE